MKQSSNYLIDPRAEEDLRRELRRLAASYTPEWLFDEEKPDVGSVIGMIFTRQMAENVRKINRLPEKYRTEFVNMLGLPLLPAFPAHGVVNMGLIPDTVPGLDVPAGTQLLGEEGEGGDSFIFETLSDVHITASRLRTIFTVSPHQGKIIPLMGEIKSAPLVEAAQLGGEEEASAPDSAELPQMAPISLFNYAGEGVERNALLLYHQSIFDTPAGVSISVRMIDAVTGADIAPRFADLEKYRWSYYAEGGFVPFAQVRVDGGRLLLEKQEESRTVTLEGREYSLVCLETLGPVRETVALRSLRISAACELSAPQFVAHNEEELTVGEFMPFGDTASLFDECYIGHDRIFSQQGAVVTIKFNLSFKEKMVQLSLAEKEEELKVIKRRSTPILYETARTCPQRIGLDYFNGTGWRRLECRGDYTTLLDGSVTGEMALSFVCPDDWRSTVTGGLEGRALRLRVVEADNCYLRPCIHNMPVMSGLTISYSYYGEWKYPHRLHRVSGTSRTDLTGRMLEGEDFAIFEPLAYAENALYLGFDQKMEGSPISILFDVEESMHFTPSALRFDYSTKNGFSRIKVLDHTDNMSRVGTVLFLPQSDFAELELEGVRRYWIRIVDEENAYDRPGRYHAVLKSIMINAVEVHNVRTLPEESFFIDRTSPGMSFPLAAENILSADVFVNEVGRLSQAAMKEMLRDRPEDVRAEYNFLGAISDFFVRWTEVENFDDSSPGDRHYQLDRMDNAIIFGDGLSVAVPEAQTGVAFTVTVRCCDGARGNLPRGAISAPFGQMLYVDSIYNPIATYAGSNIESIESAHRRGASILNSKNRLVSELDFVREVKAFSSSIDKVRCVIGQDPDGRRDDRLVSIAVLMKDFAAGSYSFYSLQSRLREWLLQKCELSLRPDQLIVTEPLFVDISVDVWARTRQVEHFFETQNAIRTALEEYLNPLSTESRDGWSIGTLPKKAQIDLLLHSVKSGAGIARYIATARYSDKNGVHERGLDDLAGNPFMIGVNGEHRVHMLLAGDR